MAKKAQKTSYIVGNWKMYKTIDEALEFLDTISASVEKANARVMIAAPYTALKSMSEKNPTSHVVIGAQNMNDASDGAFTGEVAASMIKDAGAEFVILGHSERRRLFHETDECINKKVKRALQSSLQPIVCIGESYEEHEQKQTEEVLARQLTAAFNDVDAKDIAKCIIAYEPIWAIGTGLAADPKTVANINTSIRKILADIAGEKEAKNMAILYGGSVSKDNAQDYVQTEGIDGLLIGSASLQPETFAKIITLCAQ